MQNFDYALLVTMLELFGFHVILYVPLVCFLEICQVGNSMWHVVSGKEYRLL